jgi:hypothetical protein
VPTAFKFSALRHVNNFGHPTNTPSLDPFAQNDETLPLDKLGCLAIEWIATDSAPVTSLTIENAMPPETSVPAQAAPAVPATPDALGARPVVCHESLAAAVPDTGTRNLQTAFAMLCTPEQLSADNTWCTLICARVCVCVCMCVCVCVGFCRWVFAFRVSVLRSRSPRAPSSLFARYCSGCKSHTEATKHMRLFRTPRYLLVHLRRFSWRHVLLSAKLNCLVDFPLDGLDISSYFAPEASVCTAPYSLVGVVQHFGTLSGGHYTAAVRVGSEWHECDDQNVRTLAGSDVVTRSAYILVYKRNE